MISPMNIGILSLSWYHVALAASLEPIIAERVVHRDLEVRQASACEGSYTSKNGMKFTNYCNLNNAFNDASPPFKSSSMKDCLEHCSRYWGDGEGCYGIVWIEKTTDCWLRNSTTSTKGFQPTIGTHAALIEEGQLNATDTKCPGNDLSSRPAPNIDNLNYTLHCGKSIQGFDACFAGYAGCFESPYKGFWHADSLEQCLAKCMKEHPLCKAVTFNPDMKIGFANCWPKTGYPQTLTDPTKNQGILHSATLPEFQPVNNACTNETVYKSGDDFDFKLSCGTSSRGINMTSLHTQNITACMDACIKKRPDCYEIVFDTTLQDGYENCYLKNITGTIWARDGVHRATYAGRTNGKKASKAWIAGPVVGGLVIIVVVACFLWWRRRKAAKSAESDMAEQGSTEKKHPEAYGTPLNEVDGTESATEMPSSTKYAHMLPTNEQPVELAGSTEYKQMNARTTSPQELP